MCISSEYAFSFSRGSGDNVLVVEHGRHAIGCKKKEKNLDWLDHYNLKNIYIISLLKKSELQYSSTKRDGVPPQKKKKKRKKKETVYLKNKNK